MRRSGLLWIIFALGCTSAEFDVAAATEDTGVANDTGGGGADEGVVEHEIGAPDTELPVDAPPPCPRPGETATDLYVDASSTREDETGSAECPFRTLFFASNFLPAPGGVRTVHVRAGSYSEPAFFRVRSGETYVAEGGVVKYTAAGTVRCSSSKTCGVQIETGGTLNGFSIDASKVANGIYVSSDAAAPTIKNTTVRGALEDGVVVEGTSANVGPQVAVIENGWSGLVMNGSGRLNVTGTGNRFDNNKGGFWSGSNFIPGAGIHMLSGNIFLDGGTSASGNYVGVLFAWSGSSGALQTLSQLTAQLNRHAGVVVNKGWTKLQLRKSVLTKNANVGLRLEWDSARTNDFDIGKAGYPGSNVFGGATQNNGKGGIFLCGSPATAGYAAEANQWANCPIQQVMANNCDTLPTSWTDVVYVPHSTVGTTLGVNPVSAPTACTKGP